MDIKACAVLPAAGSGERCGGGLPKQYSLVGNTPLLCRTLKAFTRVPWIVKTVVVVAPDRVDYATDLVQTQGFSDVVIVPGGATRHRSIYAGVRAVRELCPDMEVVVIHDAVRPFLDEDILHSVTLAAHTYKAAGVTRPLVSTVIAADQDGFLDHSLDRSKHRASEMPQAFQLSVIEAAYQKCSEWDYDHGTECLHLVHVYCGVSAKLIPGPDSLWKVTYSRDLKRAESTVKDQNSNIYLHHSSCGAMAEDVKSSLQEEHHRKVVDEIQPHLGAAVYIISDLQHTPHPPQSLYQTLYDNIGVIIYVFVPGASVSVREQFTRLVRSRSEMNSGVPVYGVLHSQGSSVSHLVKLINTLLTERNAGLSGQTLTSY